MSLYRQAIIEATSASGKDVEYIEDIMRHDIFHSTLDWLSRAQLARGARAAAKLLSTYRDTPLLAAYFPRA